MKRLILFIFFAFPFCFQSQLKDRQNNSYLTQKIGNQEWMAENLRTTVFNDGNAIPFVSGNKSWMETTNPAYCFYENKVENRHSYGLLYNFYTIESNKICPFGWHVPTEMDWQELICFVGDEQTAGLYLKSEFLWAENGTGLNSYNFSALPSGGRKYTGVFDDLLTHGSWWSATEEVSLEQKKEYAISFQMIYWNSNVISWINKKQEGYPIRCVKDQSK
jgi:uncharacterized protein (TIGR02145 family)